MISRRSKWLLVATSLAPLGLGFGLLADWLHQRCQRVTYPAWIIDEKAPWYIPALVIVFYIGVLSGIGTIVSVLLDYRRHKRTDARHS